MLNRIRDGKLHVTLLVLVALLALGSGLARGQTVEGQVAPLADLGSGFTYQGVLQKGGKPVDGLCDLRFTLWDSANDGAQIGGVQALSGVTVEEGLFMVELNGGSEFGSTAFNGAARWLEVGVQCDADTDFTTLSPRKALTAVPYAHGLRPGASVVAEGGPALNVESTSTSASSLVVSGLSTSSASPSLRVDNSGADGYGLYVNKTNGAGVASFGSNNGSTGSGTVGYSANWYGLYGYTGASNHNYGIYSPDNLFTRNVTASGSMMMVAQNQSGQILEAGDVAAFAGISDGLENEGQPIIQVAPATVENSSAVAGVVYSRFAREWLNAPPEGLANAGRTAADPKAGIAPGDYMLLVVYGPAQVKNSGGETSVEVGDLLTIGGIEQNEVSLTTADTTGSGAVFGKALEAAAPDKPLIYVFVTLQ
jgi:hypothetical protein